jgi:UDP-N-acetylmuramoyl-tripeptide--D-alanyl-D-alanine ligase
MRHLYEAVPQTLRAAHTETAADLAPIIAESVAAGDAILVKGSLGSRMKHVVDALDALAGPKAGAA